MKNKKIIGSGEIVITRYAPSPTGKLHIGGARTALFNYLLAKKYDGKFILRIEDTDVERNIEGGHISMENDLKLLNIFPDESFSIPGKRGPYLQSQKIDRYSELCEKLLKEEKAYRCFCTEEELKSERDVAIKNNSTPLYSKKCRLLKENEIEKLLKKNVPYTVRLKADIVENYCWDDLVRGNISIPESSMSDPVIMRSNGMPMYNFAVVVDDYDMGVNYVLRGEEHIPNTPVQIALYHALGWSENIPTFGHLSIIIDNDKKKLSKRSGNEFHFISSLLQKGYPSEAIFNFLVLLGWSCGEREIFNQEELIKIFDPSGLSKAPAFFDIEKLNWLSHKYFQEMSSSYFLNFVGAFFTEDLGINNERKTAFALVNKNNIYCASQLNQLAKDFFKQIEISDSQKKFLKNHKPLLSLAKDYFPDFGEAWDQTTIRNYLKQLMQLSDLSGKNFFKPLRIAFSFQDKGFELAGVMECLGRERIFNNLEKSLSFCD